VKTENIATAIKAVANNMNKISAASSTYNSYGIQAKLAIGEKDNKFGR